MDFLKKYGNALVCFFENLYDIADFNFDPFYANVPFLYALEASANSWFSDVFMGYSNGAFA